MHRVNTARGVLRRLRPDAHAVHDAAGGGELQGILPLLRRRPGRRAHHAVRSARAVSRALRQEPAGLRSGAARARRARCAAALPRARLRPQHRRVRGRGRRAVRHRLHEPGAGRRPALGRPGQLRLDRRPRRRAGGRRRRSSRGRAVDLPLGSSSSPGADCSETVVHARDRGGVPDDRSGDLRSALAHPHRADRAGQAAAARRRSRPRCTSR